MGRARAQDSQDARLIQLWEQGLAVQVIAAEIGFKDKSVTHAARRLGLARRKGNQNTEAATAASVRAYREGKRDLSAANEARRLRAQSKRGPYDKTRPPKRKQKPEPKPDPVIAQASREYPKAREQWLKAETEAIIEDVRRIMGWDDAERKRKGLSGLGRDED